MAPIDSAVDDIKSLVLRLEDRISTLESKLEGSTGSASAPTQTMRMILMGPPGAGMLLDIRSPQKRPRAWHVNRVIYRQGNPGTEDQGQVLRLPSRTYICTSLFCPHIC